MQLSLSFIRIVFSGLSVLISASYAVAGATSETIYINLGTGIMAGLAIGLAAISLEKLFTRFNLRTFNVITLGLLFGYLMGEVLNLILQAALNAKIFSFNPEIMVLMRGTIYLLTGYLGMIMTARASEELYACIPFVKFRPISQKKKDLLIEPSLLLDARIIDLASTGLLDHYLALPRFLVKEFQISSENSDEAVRTRARRSLETIKKLESIPTLEMRYIDYDFPEIKDPLIKLIRIARLLDANIFTADPNRIQQTSLDGVHVINLFTLSSALKPLAQTGEYINIKIQRYGKEPRQGVGYLEDGTMVVVNGGAEFIGETIRAQVLSVKHTSSGRMIFCNALEEGIQFEQSLLGNSPSIESENQAKSYFAL